jgi:hypothetical protein
MPSVDIRSLPISTSSRRDIRLRIRSIPPVTATRINPCWSTGR